VSAWSLDLPRVLSNLRDRLLALLGWGGYLTARLATRRSTLALVWELGDLFVKLTTFAPFQLGDRFTPVFLCRLGFALRKTSPIVGWAGTYPAVREE